MKTLPPIVEVADGDTLAQTIDNLSLSSSTRDALLAFCKRTYRTGECEIISRRDEPSFFVEIERCDLEQLAAQIHHPVKYIKGRIHIYPYKKPEEAAA